MVEAGFKEVETYVSRRQNTVTQFIANRSIMDLCLLEERRPGSRVTNQWWEHDRLYVEGMLTAAQKSEWTEVGKKMYGTKTETNTD